MRVLAGVVAYVVTSFLVGATIGYWRSPDWESATTADQALARGVVSNYDASGYVQLTAACATRRYSYDQKSDSLQNELVSLELLRGLPYAKKGGFEQLKGFMSLAFGPPVAIIVAAGAVGGLLPVPYSDDVGIAVGVGVAVFVISGTIGYAAVYDTSPDCGAKAVRAAFGDIANWRQLAKQYQELRRRALIVSLKDYCTEENSFFSPNKRGPLKQEEWDVVLSAYLQTELQQYCTKPKADELNRTVASILRIGAAKPTVANDLAI